MINFPPDGSTQATMIPVPDHGRFAAELLSLAPGRRGRIRISFEVHEQHAPAFRSAVEEISNEVGGRLEGPFSYARQDALTAAACALGSLRAATFAAIPAGDPAYEGQ
jgi:hypothetical protein